MVADRGPGPEEKKPGMHPRPLEEAVRRICELHALLAETHQLTQIKPWITETWVRKGT